MRKVKILSTATVFLVITLTMAACALSATPASTQTTTATAPAAVFEAKPMQQQKWESLVAEAKKEGELVICGSAESNIRQALSSAFTGKYGIRLEFISGKPAQLAPKVLAERRAGVYYADMFLAGAGTVVPVLGPEGHLEPLDNVLLLPEVVDNKAWWGGEILWMNSNRTQVAFFATPVEPLAINTDLVKSEEIKSYRDLLSPKWKGKITFLDPTMAGSGNSIVIFIVEGSSLGWDYLRELAKQEPIFSRDNRLLVEWLARGKYPLAIGISPEIVTDFSKNGAPVKVNPVAEGTYLSSPGAGVVLLKKAPHRNAAVVFINWLLSREGQTVASRTWGLQSARMDVPTDHLMPHQFRQPGVKYYSLISEGLDEKREEYMKAAMDVYGHLLK